MILWLLCGIPGSGKSTFAKKFVEQSNYKVGYVSRDEIRFSMVNEKEEYFSKEDKVFNKFVDTINSYIENEEYTSVIADATHINEASRKKLLNKLQLDDVSVYCVVLKPSLGTCLKNNEKRIGREVVPRSVIRRMHAQFSSPSEEEYPYAGVLTLREMDYEEE